MRTWSEFVPSGRLGRRAFWARHLIGLPIALFLCIAADTLIGRPAGLLAAALTTLFLVSVWGRRLHDRGRSAWWLLAAAIPVLGALALIVDCALLGTRSTAASYGAAPGVRADYRTV
jgi:uncharacterized membrane protein YhaH (DUF805 family)